MHGTTSDYCFHLLLMISLFPKYVNKQRASTTIRQYLETQHISYSNKYILKVHSKYDARSMKSWARACIDWEGEYRPHWKEHAMDRLAIIIMPSTSWNLKLVNVQKTCKSHVWGNSCSSAPIGSQGPPDPHVPPGGIQSWTITKFFLQQMAPGLRDKSGPRA